MTVKELMQKLIDEKIVTGNSALQQFLKSVIDDEVKNDTATNSKNETELTQEDLAFNKIFNAQ